MVATSSAPETSVRNRNDAEHESAEQEEDHDIGRLLLFIKFHLLGFLVFHNGMRVACCRDTGFWILDAGSSGVLVMPDDFGDLTCLEAGGKTSNCMCAET
ncbi:MAG: hypothetical protein QF886_00340 [Planctomycetota bacterium]|nr:hypothetical protein [Planctomycetota bacterium]